MPLCINQSGTYRNARTVSINQSGTIRNIVTGCINQASTYRCFGFTAATITSFTATPSSADTGCSTTLCWTIANATSASISPTVGTISPAVTGNSVVTPGATTTFTLSVGGGGASLSCAITFTDTGPALGSSYCGGFLICKESPNLRWVVSPSSAEVCRTWYSREDAVTSSQAVTGVGGWFVPTIQKLDNPGFTCRDFWGPSPCYSPIRYWSSTETDAQGAYLQHFAPFAGGQTFCRPKTYSNVAVRAFRCVTY